MTIVARLLARAYMALVEAELASFTQDELTAAVEAGENCGRCAACLWELAGQEAA